MDLVLRVERMPTSTSESYHSIRRLAGSLRYPSIRRILVHQLPTITPQAEEHGAFFKFLKVFWKGHHLSAQASNIVKRLELKILKDVMSQTERILQAVSARYS